MLYKPICVPRYIPDQAVSCIQILSSHCSNNSACWCVLIKIHCVVWFTENRRLIHIQNINLDSCCVFKWTKTVKPWVQVCIWCLNCKGIGLFCLVVQRLWKNGNKWINNLANDSFKCRSFFAPSVCNQCSKWIFQYLSLYQGQRVPHFHGHHVIWVLTGVLWAVLPSVCQKWATFKLPSYHVIFSLIYFHKLNL